MNDTGGLASAVMVSRTGWVLAAIALVELTKHIALLSLGQAQPWGDSFGYWNLGGDAAAGDWWLSGSGNAQRTPGYPWIVAVCRWMFDTAGLLSVVLLQHGCVLVTSLMTTWITWRLTERVSAAAVAWAWCALSTARPLYANWLLTETLATCALMLVVVALLRAASHRPLRWMVIASGVLGCGILIRPALVAVVPALAAGAWWIGNEADTRRQRWARVGASLAVLAVLLTPWCVRNGMQFHCFTLTISTGRQLWKSAFDPWPGGELPIPQDGAGAGVRERLPEGTVDLRHNWSVSSALARSGLADREVDALMEQAAWQAIRRNPGRFLIRLAARCATFWYVREWEVDSKFVDQADFAEQTEFRIRPWQPTLRQLLRYTPERWFPAMWAWSVVTWLGIAGLIVRPAQRRIGWVLALILMGMTFITAGLEVPLYRYRLVVEPLMIVASVAGIARLFRRTREVCG